MQRIFLFVGSLFLLFSADLVTGAEAPKYGGRLVLAIRNDISGLNPFVRTTSTNVYVRQLVYEALLDFDKHGKLIPDNGYRQTIAGRRKRFREELTARMQTIGWTPVCVKQSMTFRKKRA